VNLQAEELPGKGGQPEPRRYNDWLAEAKHSPSAALVAAPTNSPLSLRVFVCSPSIHGHVPVYIHFGKLCVAAGHSNGKADISGGSHLADAGDKARPYLPILAKGVAYNNKKPYILDRCQT